MHKLMWFTYVHTHYCCLVLLVSMVSAQSQDNTVHTLFHRSYVCTGTQIESFLPVKTGHKHLHGHYTCKYLPQRCP